MRAVSAISTGGHVFVASASACRMASQSTSIMRNVVSKKPAMSFVKKDAIVFVWEQMALQQHLSSSRVLTASNLNCLTRLFEEPS